MSFLFTEPNMFSSTLMMPGLGTLPSSGQMYPGCNQIPHQPAQVGPGKQDTLSSCWQQLYSTPSSAGSLLNTHPQNSFAADVPQPGAQGSSALPAFHDNPLNWPDEKDSSFYRNFSSTNGMGAVAVSTADVQSVSSNSIVHQTHQASNTASIMNMETDDMNCTSINFEKYNQVLNVSNHRQQLHQVPPACPPVVAPGSTPFNSQSNLADPAVYSFLDQEVLSESRLSTNPLQNHQNSIADSQFYDTDGVHTDELYQSFQFDTILQSYNH